MFIQAQNFTQCYYKLVELITDAYQFESAPRGMKIKESIPVMFQIEDPRNRMLYVPERKFSTSYMVAEAVWYFLGDNRTDWISNYAKFWEGISDDGETANSAYGARIFKPHNYIADNAYTQWDYVKEELTRDRDSRRAIIHIRTPEDSVYAKKDVPCTLSLQFFIRNDKLYMVANMRSSDLILGISYDIPAFTMFQEALANELGVGLGTYTHISNSLHVYERHFDMCNQILKNKKHCMLPLDFQAMPAMPKDIPIQRLNDLQWSARNVDDPLDLQSVFLGWKATDEDVYWKDWGFILLKHRAMKLNHHNIVAWCDDSISFEGYK